MCVNSRNNQTNKKAPHAKDKIKQAKQSSEAEKFSDKTR